jgi:hypothetical protein
VPQIRSSSYVTLLAEALLSLRKFSPGIIQEEALPDLKDVVAMDDTPQKFHEMRDIHCAVYFSVRFFCTKIRGKPFCTETKGSLNKDVINVQGLSCFLGMGDLNILNPTRSRTTGEAKAVSAHLVSVGRCRPRANAADQTDFPSPRCVLPSMTTDEPSESTHANSYLRFTSKKRLSSRVQRVVKPSYKR